MISTAPYVGALAGTALAIYVQGGEGDSIEKRLSVSLKNDLSLLFLSVTFISYRDIHLQ